MGWSEAQRELWAKLEVWEMEGMEEVAIAWEEEWEDQMEGVWARVDHWECLWEMGEWEAITWEVVGRARIWTSEERVVKAGEHLCTRVESCF